MVKGNKRRRSAAGITAAEPKRVSGVGAVPPRSRVKFMHFSVCRVWRRAPVFGGAQRRRLVYIIRAHVAWSEGIRKIWKGHLKGM